MSKVVAYVIIPIGVAIAIFSKEILWIVYGPKYTDVSIIVVLFAFISIFNSICSFYDMLGIAKGRTDLNFYNTVARVVITTPIVYVTSLVSVEVVAIGQLIATVLQSIAFWMIVVNNTYPMSFRHYFSHFSKWLYIQLGCFVVMKFFMYEVGFNSTIINIALYTSLYIVIMLLSVFCFMRKDIQYFRTLIKR